ncbi:MAG: hypothetical protein OXN17_14500 [Candidatus Poribacteria bacterium]|nr:hypothetical protein [Candidatus Poribacteria bacterium]
MSIEHGSYQSAALQRSAMWEEYQSRRSKGTAYDAGGRGWWQNCLNCDSCDYDDYRD